MTAKQIGIVAGAIVAVFGVIGGVYQGVQAFDGHYANKPYVLAQVSTAEQKISTEVRKINTRGLNIELSAAKKYLDEIDDKIESAKATLLRTDLQDEYRREMQRQMRKHENTFRTQEQEVQRLEKEQRDAK